MTEGRTSEGILAAAVRAEHLRRRRLVTRVLLRVVPAVAGGLLVTAALIRLLHAPVAAFWIAFALAIAGVAVFAWIKGRVPAVTDLAASQLDDDAGLAGELRSAHWFASNQESNVWTTFHLGRAADRLESVSWPAVYPPLKTARAWAGSAVLALAAVAVVMTTAWPLAKSATVVAGAKKDGGPASGIPTDLQKQIDDLLNAIQSGAIPMDVARNKLAELREKLSDIDPKMAAAMAKAAADRKPGDASSKEADALAAKAEKTAAKPFLPQDMKWSMEDLASKLKYAGKPTEKADGEESQKQAEASPNSAGEKSNQGEAKPGDAQMSMTRTSAADAQSSQMMMATMSPMGGERGENKDPKKGQVGLPLDLKGGLRKEEIAADSDSAGANVLAEMRKKSEQSHSALGFSKVAPLAAYDKSHAAPPPPPADAVRPLLKKYFIRKSGG